MNSSASHPTKKVQHKWGRVSGPAARSCDARSASDSAKNGMPQLSYICDDDDGDAPTPPTLLLLVAPPAPPPPPAATTARHFCTAPLLHAAAAADDDPTSARRLRLLLRDKDAGRTHPAEAAVACCILARQCASRMEVVGGRPMKITRHENLKAPATCRLCPSASHFSKHCLAGVRATTPRTGSLTSRHAALPTPRQ